MSTTRPRPHPALAERRRQVVRARGRRRRAAVLALLGAAAVAAAAWWVLTGPLLAVRDVTLTGYDRGDRPRLQEALEAAAARGTVVRPPVDELRRATARFPWVESLTVARTLPRGLSIDVVMARPAAVAATPEAAVLVSATGRVLEEAPPRAGLGWIRLPRAPPRPGAPLPRVARAPLELLVALDADLARRVRALRLGGGVLIGRLAGGPELRLGEPERLEAKARALKLVLDHLSPADERAAAYIDLSVPERPAVGGAEGSTTG